MHNAQPKTCLWSTIEQNSKTNNKIICTRELHSGKQAAESNGTYDCCSAESNENLAPKVIYQGSFA